jgi:iron(III) transport system substrate-binding protein
MNPRRARLPVLTALACMAGLATPALAQQSLNLYTTREPGLVRPLLEAFTTQTGVRVNTVFVKDGLAERVAAEGARSPADVLMAVDMGNMVDLVEKGVTQPVKSERLQKTVPANLRDAGDHWYALSMRARVVYASKKLGLKTISFEELADPRYKGRVCVRSGQHPYNTALIAGVIAEHGPVKAEEWLRGVKANLARRPGGGDRDVARDILAGICDVGLANSYYVGLMRSGQGGPEQQKWAEAVDVLMPTLGGKGSHVNISGAALAKNAPNRAAAVTFMEWLVSDEAQDIYARANFEHPVTSAAKLDPIVASFGALKVHPAQISEIVKHRKLASELVDKVGFDN